MTYKPPVGTKWTTDCPEVAGVYYMKCMETDGDIERVIVWLRADGVLMAKDVHLGDMGVADLHNGLTNIQWGYAKPVYLKLVHSADPF